MQYEHALSWLWQSALMALLQMFKLLVQRDMATASRLMRNPITSVHLQHAAWRLHLMTSTRMRAWQQLSLTDCLTCFIPFSVTRQPRAQKAPHNTQSIKCIAEGRQHGLLFILQP